MEKHRRDACILWALASYLALLSEQWKKFTQKRHNVLPEQKDHANLQKKIRFFGSSSTAKWIWAIS